MARPVPGTPAEQPDDTGGSQSGRSKKRNKKRRSRGSIDLGGGKRSKKGPPVADFDVELLPVQSSTPSGKLAPNPVILPPVPPQRGGGGLTRRDLLMLAIGAGSVVATIATAGVAASGGPAGFLRRLGLMSGESGEQ